MPDDLLLRLRDFHSDYFPRHQQRFQDLVAQGQHPKTLFIGCSDSRLVPYLLTGAAPGELFLVRNVGAFIPPYDQSHGLHGTMAAIEFAVLNLRVKHLIIMGHSGCGGVKAALDQSAAIQTEAQFISRWMSMLDDARLRVLASHQTSPHHEKLAALEKEGIKNSIKNLRTFPFVKEREDAGKLTLRGTHFAIAEGELHLLDETAGTFGPAA